ncbi:hypothetical protein O3P69_013530 [Scylla paramamosain]|uniref:Secreted protein n=1 Tax=Scylla paramamosain TaxID=85552 RepID=A0AAW0SFW9_SCYPA
MVDRVRAFSRVHAGGVVILVGAVFGMEEPSTFQHQRHIQHKELLGVAFTGIMRMEAGSGDHIKTWHHNTMKVCVAACLHSVKSTPNYTHTPRLTTHLTT